MPAVRELQGMGSFTIDIRDTPKTVWRELVQFHTATVFVIRGQRTSQQLESWRVSELAARAWYAGVLLDLSDITSNDWSLDGAGLAWWLGDRLGNGPTLGEREWSDTNSATVIEEILEDAPLEIGTIHDNDHDWSGTVTDDTTILQALDIIATDTQQTWRIHNLAIDFGTAEQLYRTEQGDCQILGRESDIVPEENVSVCELYVNSSAAHVTDSVLLRTRDLQATATLLAAHKPQLFDPRGNLYARRAVYLDTATESVRSVSQVGNLDAIEAESRVKQRLLQHARLQIRMRATLPGDHHISDRIDPGDTAGIVNLARWGDIDTGWHLQNNASALPVTIVQIARPITKLDRVALVRNDTQRVLDITPWVVAENDSSIVVQCGDWPLSPRDLVLGNVTASSQPEPAYQVGSFE